MVGRWGNGLVHPRRSPQYGESRHVFAYFLYISLFINDLGVTKRPCKPNNPEAKTGIIDPESPIPAREMPIPARKMPIPAQETPIPARETPIPAQETPIPALETPIAGRKSCIRG